MARYLKHRERETSGGPEWFAPKRYGFGAGLPIAWQGWALIIAYVAIMGGAGLAFERRLWVLVAIVLPATLILLLIASRTTRGGWRWRWGKEK